ncbi:hypothetical protein IIZ77_00870 [Candidatus Saccharibacteria bacterium]|nr:hypothetical protein [Candidatus Saccharibacteria bacterium]
MVTYSSAELHRLGLSFYELYTPNQYKNKKEKTARQKMRESSSTWVRNRNTVRHTPKTLGSVSQGVILGILVLVIGLIYVTQGTKATSYDYELSEIETEISELEARKEDLAVERARLTSIAMSNNNEVAASMPQGQVSGYAE